MSFLGKSAWCLGSASASCRGPTHGHSASLLLLQTNKYKHRTLPSPCLTARSLHESKRERQAASAATAVAGAGLSTPPVHKYIPSAAPATATRRPPELLRYSFERPLLHSFAVKTVASGGAKGKERLQLQLVAGHGEQDSFVIPSIWLRDHCQCATCIHPETKQRMFEIFPEHDAAAMPHYEIAQHSRDEAGGIRITWNDGHASQYSAEALGRSWSSALGVLDERQGRIPVSVWSESGIQQEPPSVDFEAIMSSEAGVGDWTRQIREHGFCFVDRAPPTAAATEALLGRIGPVRNTQYGAFWEFTADLSRKDTAYTNMALDLHNDTTYFSDPAGLQMFHLLGHSDGAGGESQLLDGFRAAALLFAEDEQAYWTLASTKLLAHSSGNAGLSIQPQAAFSVFEHDDVSGLLKRVRWNNADRAAFTILPPDTGPDDCDPALVASRVEDWYRAAAKLVRLLRARHGPVARQLFYEFRMQPGRPLIFDNWRLLHGRSGFTGKRTLCGGYINMDDFISRFRTSNFGHAAVLRDGIY